MLAMFKDNPNRLLVFPRIDSSLRFAGIKTDLKGTGSPRKLPSSVCGHPVEVWTAVGLMETQLSLRYI